MAGQKRGLVGYKSQGKAFILLSDSSTIRGIGWQVRGIVVGFVTQFTKKMNVKEPEGTAFINSPPAEQEEGNQWVHYQHC